MNITKQIFKKSVLVGTIALSIAVFAGCSDSANSSTADTTKPTEAQTTVQATEGTAKSGTTNESFDLKSLHTCKENDEDDLVGTWQITSGEVRSIQAFTICLTARASLYSSAELRDISANTATIPMMTTIRHLPQSLFSD